jgi:hypothetical protein
MYRTVGTSPTALPSHRPAHPGRFDPFSMIFTGISGGSVQHRLSAVHEHNG